MKALQRDLTSIIGLPISGVARSIGSAISIEIGPMVTQTSGGRPHGIAHLLVIMPHWRITKSELFIASSDWDKSRIDDTISSVFFGNIISASTANGGWDLNIKTDLQYSFTISWFGIGWREGERVWTLYLRSTSYPDKLSSWSLNATGDLVYQEDS